MWQPKNGSLARPICRIYRKRSAEMTPGASMNTDYYELLRVADDADSETIVTAYKKLVFEAHPDRNQSSAEATAKTAELNRAYQTLSNPAARAKYDSQRRSRHSSAKPEIPWIVLGTEKLALYDM